MNFSDDNKHNLIDGIVLFLLFAYLFAAFPPDLLLLKTTINGGDTGSHYPCAVYLKNVLLPQGKIMGWMQGNYAGLPLFYHYFPLPFLLAAGLSTILSMQIAFKLITVLGIFLLPVCAYFSFRCLKYRFPTPILAAVFTLPFLFNQGNSMWGGNIASTLAGEFCYSLGFALALLFTGTLYRGISDNRYLVLNAALIFLIATSHAYTFIFCLIPGSFFFLANPKRNLKYLAGVYGLAFVLLAFWTFPLLANLPYTTSFVFRWTIHSVLEVFPVVMLPSAGLAIIAFGLNLKDNRTFYFFYLFLFCAAVYAIGPHIGILDIRFVPFVQMLLCVWGAVVIKPVLKKIRFSTLLPFILFGLVVLWTDSHTTYIKDWVKWNYTGYEQKKTWPTFNEINNYLKNAGSGRVVWEHTPLDESLGSIRTSETLPYFAKRQTLEGIHMLGTHTAPFVFYMESETSFQPCNPIPDYFYSTLNLKSGIDHFRLFNVEHFVARSPQLKALAEQYPQLRLEKVVAGYNIYRVLADDYAYVTPLKNMPVLFITDDWRDIAYQWFAKESVKDTFLVFKNKATPKDKLRFKQIVSRLDQIESIPFTNSNVTVKSEIHPESIDIETSKIGNPLLIKVSYHPNWTVCGADRVYPVSPSFMLIFPTQHKVHLSFEPGLPAKAGTILTLLGIVLALSTPFWLKKYFPAQTQMDAGHKKYIWIVLFGLTTAGMVSFFEPGAFNSPPAAVLKKARMDFDQGRYDLARDKFKEVIQISKKSSGTRCEAMIFHATAWLRKNRFKAAAEEFNTFIKNYPSSFWTPQATFDLAYCRAMLGNRKRAAAIYRRIIKQFPTTTWATYSKERLKKLHR